MWSSIIFFYHHFQGIFKPIRHKILALNFHSRVREKQNGPGTLVAVYEQIIFIRAVSLTDVSV
jgi:hypothetical protein